MISIKNLNVNYKKNIIYNNVSIEFPKNEISFLMGKNGSGKTTLIKCILNQMYYKGKILINNHLYNNDATEVFVIFDDSTIYKNLSGIDNIRLLTGLKKEEIYRYSDSFLDRTLLEKKAKTYSYGERKKLSLIIIDIIKPKIVIMDEVSNGLDYESMSNLRNKILEWSKNSSILLTGHQFEFYKNIINRIYVINNQSIHSVDYNNDTTLEEIYEETIK